MSLYRKMLDLHRERCGRCGRKLCPVGEDIELMGFLGDMGRRFVAMSGLWRGW